MQTLTKVQESLSSVNSMCLRPHKNYVKFELLNINFRFWISFALNLMTFARMIIGFSFFVDFDPSIHHNSFMLPSIASLYTSIIMLIMCGRIGDHIGRLSRFEPSVILLNNEEESTN